jgi:acetyl esterase/lipase
LPGAGGGKKFVVWGHSQGGHAALFTGIIAKSYAPELDLLGVAAAAPATDLATLMNEDIDSVGGKNITAMTLWSWQRVFDANMDKVVDPRAMPAIDQLAQECIEGPFDLRRRQLTEQPLEQYFLTTKHPSDVEPWHTLLAENSPGALPPEIPVFLAQGTDDVIIHPEVTKAYAAKLCKAGSKVRMLSMPNIGHGRAAQASTRRCSTGPATGLPESRSGRWHKPAVRGWAEHVRSARVFQTSTCSAIARASSTSMPRYRTVLSILVCPSKSWTALRLPVRR